MIEVLNPGIYSSIQDFGRIGFRKYGVPVSGSLDKHSMICANRKLGNPDNQPVIEIFGGKFELRSHSECSIGYAGAKCDCRLNGKSVSDTKVELKSQDIVSFDRPSSGWLLYLTFDRALMADNKLGSVSTLISSGIGGHHGRNLRKGDQLDFTDSRIPSINPSTSSQQRPFASSYTLRFMEGREYARLDDQSKSKLVQESFAVTTDSNRMGYRLRGSKIMCSLREIRSSAVLPGTVQLPGDGNPIVLMNDCQTTGGYPRIAQVLRKDVELLAQSPPKSLVRFQKVTYDEARVIDKNYPILHGPG